MSWADLSEAGREKVHRERRGDGRGGEWIQVVERRFPACSCPEDNHCRVCPYTNACPTCGANAGTTCKRPSGHRGKGFVLPHEARYLLADADALERAQARVERAWPCKSIEEAIVAAREDPDAIAAWVRNLNNLARNIEVWGDRIHPDTIQKYIDLAGQGGDQPKGDTHGNQQLALGVDA